MENEKMNQLAVHSSGKMDAPSIYSNEIAFESAQRIAKALCSSDMVPQSYKGNVSNTLVAMEMANRTGSSVLMVMQNLNVIHGKPSWSSAFIIAALNSCGRFAPIKFRFTNKGAKVHGQIQYNDKECVAYTKTLDGNLLEGPAVSMEMAMLEGWYTKTGSKWRTMPDLMLSYRAAAFFGRLYAPDVLMGMQTAEEVLDISTGGENKQAPAPVQILNEKVNPSSVEEGKVDDAEEIIV